MCIKTSDKRGQQHFLQAYLFNEHILNRYVFLKNPQKTKQNKKQKT